MSPHRDLCVVLDIDDTLYLERDYVRSGFSAIEKLHGIAGFGDVAWGLFLDGARGNTIDRALVTLGAAPEPRLIERLVRTYREHRPEIELLPDARDWLELHEWDTHLACVTDGPLASQRAKAAALGLSRWCPTIVMTAVFGPGYGKPHPRAFQEVARVTKLPPERYIYVADNPHKDFDGPNELGWRTIRIRRKGGLHADLATPAHVDHEVGDLGGLDSLLHRFSSPPNHIRTTGAAG